MTFTLQNTRATFETYDLTCTYSAPLTGCTGDSDILVPAHSSLPVSISYNVGADTAVALLTITATSSLSGDQATWEVKVHTVFPKTVVSSAFDNQDNQLIGACAAGCFSATAAVSTVPYVASGGPHHVTLLYNADRVDPKPFVYVDVTPPGGANAPDTFRLSLKIGSTTQTFSNGDNILRFKADTTGRTVRIGGQLSAITHTSGMDSATYMVYAHYPFPTGGHVDTLVWQGWIMIVNERTSPIARGWTVAGIQHLYLQGNGSVLITQGDGSGVYYKKNGSTFTIPAGEFAALDTVATGSGTRYRRRYPDSTTVWFRSTGQMDSVVDRFGGRARLEYDGSSRPIKILDAYRTSYGGSGAAFIKLTYGTYGLSQIREPGPGATADSTSGRLTTITVDSLSTLRVFKDPDGDSTRFGYDGSRRVSTVTDRRGAVWTLTYNATSGKLATAVSPQVPIDAGGGSTTMQSLTATFVPWQTMPVPLSTTNSTPFTPVLPDSVQGRVIGAANDTTIFMADRWGQPLRIRDPLGNVTTIVRGGGLLATSITNAAGAKDSFQFSGSLLTTHTLPNNQTVRYHYGAYAQVDSIFGTAAVPQRFYLGTGGRVDSMRVASLDSTKSRIYYDALGWRDTLFVDPKGHKTKKHYDTVFGNLDSLTVPGNRFSVVRFDGYGRDSAARQNSQPWVSVLRDQLNRVTTMYDGVNGTPATITYDKLFRIRVQDPKPHPAIHRFEYDSLGRATKIFDAEDTTKYLAFRRNVQGFVTSMTNQRNQRIDRTYDKYGRPLIVSPASGVNMVPDTFTYNATGSIVTRSNGIAVDTIYSLPGVRVDSVKTWLNAKRFMRKYHYDDAQRLDSVGVTTTSGITFTGRKYTFDATLGTLSSIRLNGHYTNLGYNGELLRNYEGLPSTRAILPITTSDHALYSLNVPSFSSSTSLIWRGAGYDSLGRITQYLRQNGASTSIGRTFSYDSLGRLSKSLGYTVNGAAPTPCTADTTSGFACAIASKTDSTRFRYDAAGNDTTPATWSSTTAGATYTLGDRLSSWGATTFKYDADGNDSLRIKSASDTTRYVWTADGLLDSVIAKGGLTRKYEYDASRQLVRRRTNGSIDRYFLWDQGHLMAELDGTASNRRAEYVYDLGTDRPFALITGATSVSQIRYMVQDMSANVVGVLYGDSSHTADSLQQEIIYDPRGVVSSLSGSLGDTTRLRWKGLAYEGDSTQLYYARNRWYDPATGRFLSTDPIGLAGGPNLYAFAGGDPINYADPYGLCGYQSSWVEINPGPWGILGTWHVIWHETSCPGGGSGSSGGGGGGGGGGGVGGGGLKANQLGIDESTQGGGTSAVPISSDSAYVGTPKTDDQCSVYPQSTRPGRALRAICSSMGNSDWAQRMRGCLQFFYDPSNGYPLLPVLSEFPGVVDVGEIPGVGAHIGCLLNSVGIH